MIRYKIKICFVIDALEIGGTEKQLIEIIKKLDQTKFKVYLVCLRNSEMFADINCPKFLLNVEHLQFCNFFSKIILLKSFLQKEKIDIVQTFFIDANILGILSAKLAKVKKIISSRRDMGFWYSFKTLAYCKFTNKFVDRILVNSEAIKSNVAKSENFPKHKIDVIYNGIDQRYFDKNNTNTATKIKKELNIPSNHIIVGCVANLNRRVKRVDIFLEATAIVNSSSPHNISFLIVGDGWLRNELTELATKLNVSERIIFAGRQENISSLLSIVDIGVLSSDSEGFSNSILEYMAAGIPTVATDVGGNSELISHNKDGFLVPSRQPKLLAEAILKLINDTNLRVSMGNCAKQKARHEFSLETMNTKLEKYYSSLIP